MMSIEQKRLLLSVDPLYFSWHKVHFQRLTRICVFADPYLRILTRILRILYFIILIVQQSNPEARRQIIR